MRHACRVAVDNPKESSLLWRLTDRRLVGNIKCFLQKHDDVDWIQLAEDTDWFRADVTKNVRVCVCDLYLRWFRTYKEVQFFLCLAVTKQTCCLCSCILELKTLRLLVINLPRLPLQTLNQVIVCEAAPHSACLRADLGSSNSLHAMCSSAAEIGCLDGSNSVRAACALH